MNDLLRDLVGQRVKVWSVGDIEYADEGTLEAVDGTWLRLRGNDDEALYFSMFQVRLVKPIRRWTSGLAEDDDAGDRGEIIGFVARRALRLEAKRACS